MRSWGSYPSIYALGHKAIADLLLDPVLVEEKVDGSQFSFGIFDDPDDPKRQFIRIRSKGAEMNTLAPEKMFSKALETVQSIASKLIIGWTYRAEYLVKPKHNVLAYDRIPNGHLALFDVTTGLEEYLPRDAKEQEAARLGLEVVPVCFEGMLTDVSMLRDILGTTSFLGGQKIEGVVIKNYARFGLDKKIMLGKFVSEAFKEVHAAEWKKENPSSGDILDNLIAQYRTPARWAKAVQHLTESGSLEGSPRDIGLLMREVPTDVEKECADEIKDALYKWAWPRIRRGIAAGIPEWYKDELMKRQFESHQETGGTN